MLSLASTFKNSATFTIHRLFDYRIAGNISHPKTTPQHTAQGKKGEGEREKARPLRAE